MLRKTRALAGYALCATDGEIGTLDDFYLDDVAWTVRYFLANAAPPAGERDVLLSPIAFKNIDDAKRLIHLDLKRSKVAGSPPFSGSRPLTRGYEVAYTAYYGWPAYWGGVSRWRDELYPSELFTAAPFPPPGTGGVASSESIMMRGRNLTGRRVMAGDELLGEAVDLIVSDMSWAVHFIVVDGGRVLPGKQVLVSPRWISAMSDEERMIVVDIAPGAVREAPAYHPERPLTRDYEMLLFAHYGRADEIDEVFVKRRAVYA